jgi:hypothetical protein
MQGFGMLTAYRQGVGQVLQVQFVSLCIATHLAYMLHIDNVTFMTSKEQRTFIF